MIGLNSSKIAKKIRKKQLRCQAAVQRDAGLNFSETPTKNLVICNCGLWNGLGCEIVVENFRKFGHIEDVQMLPGKSYCCIIYQTPEMAKCAFDACNGQLQIAQNDKPIYLGFAEKIANIPTEIDSIPPDLQIIEEVITIQEEQFFMNLILCADEKTSLKHRYVKHFGYEFNYDTNNVDLASKLANRIPAECSKLFSLMGFVPDQLTVNCYKPGQGIPAHVDTHSAFEDAIVSLSLGSNVLMEFRHSNGRHVSVLLPRRSLAIMRGECRYDWTHGITPRMFDMVKSSEGICAQKRELRISYTFRKVNISKVCACGFPNMCDTQQNLKKAEISEQESRNLEDKHVRQVYNDIAEHFSDTRHKIWFNVLQFVQSFPLGSILVDIGCGNGKNMGHNLNSFEIGCDNSIGLLQVCKQRKFEVFQCNCLHMPFRSEIADGLISIAVVHHLGTAARRRQAIAEMIRLLRVGGKALVYVWAKNQSLVEKSSYLKQDRKNRKASVSVESALLGQTVEVAADVQFPIHTSRKQFAVQDLLVPWKLKTENAAYCVQADYLRFYHVFDDDELKNVCETFDDVTILKYYYDQGNWCVIIEKIDNTIQKV